MKQLLFMLAFFMGSCFSHPMISDNNKPKYELMTEAFAGSNFNQAIEVCETVINDPSSPDIDVLFFLIAHMRLVTSPELKALDFCRLDDLLNKCPECLRIFNEYTHKCHPQAR